MQYNAVVRCGWLLAALLFASRAHALDPQRAVTQYLVDNWTVDDGLPSIDVFGIAQTPDGYLWFTSDGGLTRYDGLTFYTFDRVTHPELPQALGELVVDKQGSLFIGTQSQGVVRFKGGRFDRIDHGRGLADDRVTSLTLGRDGTVWVGTAGGVTQIDGDAIRSFGSGQGLSKPHVIAVLPRANGRIWVASHGGLDELDGDRFRPLGIPTPPTIYTLFEDHRGTVWIGNADGISRLAVTATSFIPAATAATVLTFREDSDGSLWAATLERGLMRHVEGRSTWEVLGPAEGLAGHHVQGLFEDAEGSIWVACKGGGLQRLRNGKVTRLGLKQGLRGDAVQALLPARAGGVWVGLGDGGVEHVSDDSAITALSGIAANEDIHSLFEDRAGVLWAGTTTRGLVHRSAHLGDAPVVGERVGNTSTVCSLLEDRAGRMWLGGRGVSLRGVDRRWMASIGDDIVCSLQEDAAQGGVIWAGGLGGLMRLSDGKSAVVGPSQGYVGGSVLGLLSTKQSLWIGSEGGLFRYRDGAATAVRGHPLLQQAVCNFAVDGDDLWFGCADGLCRGKLAALEAASGADVPILVLDRFDGIRGDISCMGSSSVMRDAHGRLWFASTAGAVIVDPLHLGANDRAPIVVVERIVVDELQRPQTDFVEIPASAGTLRLELAAPSFIAAKKARLRYRLEGFDPRWIDAGTRRTVSYTNLPAGRYRFRAMAANADGVWGAEGQALEILWRPRVYQTLWFRIGSVLLLLLTLWALYRARVRHLGRREAELTRLVDLRTRALAEAHVDLARAERMASVAMLVRGIAHELNNPIGFIVGNLAPLKRYGDFLSGLSRQLADGTARTPEDLAALLQLTPTKDLDFVCTDLGRLLDDIREGGRRAQLIVGDLQHLMTGNERSWADVDLGRAALQSAALVRRPGARSDVVVEASDAPMVCARAGELEQVLVNLIDNALRSLVPERNGCVTVLVDSDGGYARVRVSDNGCGMSDATRARALEPFFSTRHAGEGSGLGLAIAATIVASHGGTLDIASTEGAGTVVTFRVPIRRA